MTIGLLDPSLLLKRDNETIVKEYAWILSTCRQYKIRLMPFPEYWNDLWRILGRSLEPNLSVDAKAALRQLRSGGQQHANGLLPIGQDKLGSVWKNGFDVMFDNIDGTSWGPRMAAATLRAVSSGEDVILFCRAIEKRNLQTHLIAQGALAEITRWLLHVQSKTVGRRQILCVHHPRNLVERWTTRFDWRLPSTSDDAGYPFCPPPKWWQKSTKAVDTIRSKMCWVDAHGNGWARPNINSGSGYHWDVYVQNQGFAEKIGLDQLNIVEHGVDPSKKQGKPGWIHHLPENKAGKVDLKKRGWICE
jgi:hypothetical protein